MVVITAGALKSLLVTSSGLPSVVASFVKPQYLSQESKVPHNPYNMSTMVKHPRMKEQISVSQHNLLHIVASYRSLRNG